MKNFELFEGIDLKGIARNLALNPYKNNKEYCHFQQTRQNNSTKPISRLSKNPLENKTVKYWKYFFFFYFAHTKKGGRKNN